MDVLRDLDHRHFAVGADIQRPRELATVAPAEAFKRVDHIVDVGPTAGLRISVYEFRTTDLSETLLEALGPRFLRKKCWWVVQGSNL